MKARFSLVRETQLEGFAEDCDRRLVEQGRSRLIEFVWGRSRLQGFSEILVDRKVVVDDEDASVFDRSLSQVFKHDSSKRALGGTMWITRKIPNL